MPDKRVETWASKQYVADIAKLTASISTDETDCLIVQMTPFERELLLSIVGFYLHWPTRWKMGGEGSKPGDVPEETFNEIIDNLEKHLMEPLGCGTDLARIATATESMAETMAEWYDGQYISILELKPLIYALPFGEELWLASDILGEVFEALALIPDIGIDIKMPIQDWWQMFILGQRHKAAMEKMNDLIATTHGVATGTMGPTLAGVIEQYVDDLPVLSLADKLLGKVDESIVRAVGLDLPTLLSGNYMTNKTDDVRNALDGGLIPALKPANVTSAIDRLNDQMTALGLTIAGIGQLGGVDACGCVTVGPDDDDEADDITPDEGDPPEGYEEWEAFKDDKCRHISKALDEIISLITRSYALTGSVGDIGVIAVIINTIAAMVTGWQPAYLLLGLAVGTSTVSVYAALARMIAVHSSDMSDWLAEVSSTAQDIVCPLMETGSPSAAKTILEDWLNDAASAVSADTAFLNRVDEFATNVTNFAMVNRLITLDPPLDPEYVASYDCEDCFPPDPCHWIIAPLVDGVTFPGGVPAGTGTITQDGEDFVLSSVQDDAGIHRLVIMRQWVTTHPDYPANLTVGTDCECGQGGAFSITNVSGLPSNPTLSSRGCISGEVGSISWPGTGQTSDTAIRLSIARSTGAGGAFSITMRVNP